MENSRDSLILGVRKPKNPYITTWEGFNKNPLRSSKYKLQHFQLSDTTGPLNRTGFCGQMKLRKELFGSKHTRGD